MMQNLRAFEVTYLGPTDNRGTRIKIKDLRHHKTKIISYSYEHQCIKDDAINFLHSLNISCPYCCETEKGYIILSDNFDIMIK
jgi:hypothetical protein